MMKWWLTLLLLIGMGAEGCAMAQTNALPLGSAAAKSVRTIDEEEYSQISKRIIDRVAALKETKPSLRNMTSATHYEYKVTWVLDDPDKPHSKLNGRRAVFGKDGYWFSLQFYRGKWGGAAVFLPIEFGDLKLWFQFEHGGNASVIAAIASILREEHEAFCKAHPWQSPNQRLKATGEPAP